MEIRFDTATANILLAGPGGAPGLMVEELRRPENIQAEVAWTLGGTMIRWEKPRKAVPLTLVGGDDWGWISAATLAALEAKAAIVNPATPYVLAYGATNYNVLWRFESGPVIEATPVLNDPGEFGWYADVKLKFMRILA